LTECSTEASADVAGAAMATDATRSAAPGSLRTAT
jgi:hypothetical protein